MCGTIGSQRENKQERHRSWAPLAKPVGVGSVEHERMEASAAGAHVCKHREKASPVEPKWLWRNPQHPEAGRRAGKTGKGQFLWIASRLTLPWVSLRRTFTATRTFRCGWRRKGIGDVQTSIYEATTGQIPLTPGMARPPWRFVCGGR